MEEYIIIGKIDKNKLGKYEEKVVTEDLILTYERLNTHILMYHREEYDQIKEYISEVIEKPDYILEDNSHIDTLIYLKNIEQINKKARIVVKLATDINEKIYTKNSILTIMRQRDKSWSQTIKNRGKIIYAKNWTFKNKDAIINIQ